MPTFTDPNTGREAILDGTPRKDPAPGPLKWLPGDLGTNEARWWYSDKQGVQWMVQLAKGGSLRNGPWNGYSASPDNPYGVPVGRPSLSADDLLGVLEGIDSIGYRFRLEEQNKFPWWLVALGVAAYLHSKKKRRR